MVCSSCVASPSSPKISWRTVTKQSAPERPLFGATSAIVETRRAVSPTRSGRSNRILTPAHIRRGSGTGGMKPPLALCPSGPVSESFTISGK